MTIQGEIERCTYEPRIDITKRILAYHLWGLWSLGHSDGGETGELCGYVQCRIKIFNTYGQIVDTSVVVGASCGEMLHHSRKELIDKAIIQASYNLAKYMLENVGRRYKLKLTHKSEEINRKQADQVNNGVFLLVQSK